MKTSKRLEGIGEYYFSQKLREIDELNKAGKNVINLGIGSPDLPPHPDVIKTLQEESVKPGVHGYQPYKGSPVLRNAMSEWYKRWYGVDLDPNAEILPLIGSKEGIMHICMTYLNKGDEVLVPNPGYPTYSSAVQLAGGVCKDYLLTEETDFSPDTHTIRWNFNKGITKLMFVNCPHMPTGSIGGEYLFKRLIDFARENDILIVHDNPYSFILNEKPLSMLSIEGAKDCVIELNSLSKSHNMAGWRIGMLCGAKERIDEVLRFKSNMDSGMFLPVQLAAAKALSLGKEWQDEVNAVYYKRRTKVFELLNVLGCVYSKEQAGLFVWAKVPEKYYKNSDASKIPSLGGGGGLSDEVLYKAAVFITPGGIFGSAGEKYVRVSLCCTEEKISESIQRIKSSLKK